MNKCSIISETNPRREAGGFLMSPPVWILRAVSLILLFYISLLVLLRVAHLQELSYFVQNRKKSELRMLCLCCSCLALCKTVRVSSECYVCVTGVVLLCDKVIRSGEECCTAAVQSLHKRKVGFSSVTESLIGYEVQHYAPASFSSV